MYAPSKNLYPFAPTKGMGQACPSLLQMAGISDCTDPCQVNTVTCAGANATVLPNIQSCFNTATGAPQACPVSGVTQSVTPANSGPFGTPLSVSNLNWGVLAAVLAGLVLFAGMSGK